MTRMNTMTETTAIATIPPFERPALGSTIQEKVLSVAMINSSYFLINIIKGIRNVKGIILVTAVFYTHMLYIC